MEVSNGTRLRVRSRAEYICAKMVAGKKNIIFAFFGSRIRTGLGDVLAKLISALGKLQRGRVFLGAVFGPFDHVSAEVKFPRVGDTFVIDRAFLLESFPTFLDLQDVHNWSKN